MARILLVDDQEEVRRAMRRVLERLGHQVTEAGDGREALAAMAGEPPHLVITDINMPDMDGIELMMAVRHGRVGIPIIAVSGGGMLPKELLLENAAVLGAVTTLTKPVGMEELEGAVNHALAAAEPTGETPSQDHE